MELDDKMNAADVSAPTPMPTTTLPSGLAVLNVKLSFGLSVLSCAASLIMILTYCCQKSSAPRLLFWLFLSNFFWFALFTWVSATGVLFLAHHDDSMLLQQTTCTAITAALFFFQTFSMLWPSVICFDLWQNTRDPRWRWDSPQRIECSYLTVIVLVSALAPFGVILDPRMDYCRVDIFTPSQSSWNIFLEVVLPLLAFIFNVIFLVTVRRSLRRELPFSVRTRRRRQMYNYVLVWVFCYFPYLINAFFANDIWMNKEAQMWVYAIRNATLYSSGTLCWGVYGLSNAWLKRSLRMASDRLRMTNLCCLGGVQASYLKNTTDKTVQFAVDSHYGPSHHDGDSSQRLNNKDYVTTRLSKPEKYLLFKARPDLDANRTLEVINAEIEREERVNWAEAHNNDPRRSSSLLEQSSMSGHGAESQRDVYYEAEAAPSTPQDGHNSHLGDNGATLERNSVAFPSLDNPFLPSSSNHLLGGNDGGDISSTNTSSSSSGAGGSEYTLSEVIRTEMEAQEFGISPARQLSGEKDQPMNYASSESSSAFDSFSESIRGLLSPLLGIHDLDESSSSSSRVRRDSANKALSTEQGNHV